MNQLAKTRLSMCAVDTTSTDTRAMRSKLHKKLTSTQALSVVETICIVFLTAFAVVCICLGYLYYRDTMRRGSDSHMAVTAERAAVLDTSGSSCVVKDCDGKDNCTHINSGISTGYFDHVTNTIVGEIPKGYNESTKIILDGVEYQGARGTMVIKVEYDGSSYLLSWVKGR